MYLTEQIYVFVITILIGLVVGICYDFYLVTRHQLKLRKVGTYVGDFLFGVIVTVLVFGLLLWSNWGEIRFYVFLGLGLGLAIYLKILSRSMQYILQKCFNVMSRLWKLTKITVVYFWRAVIFPFQILFMVVSLPFQILNKLFSIIKTGCRKLMYPVFARPARSIKKRLNRLKDIFKGKNPK